MKTQTDQPLNLSTLSSTLSPTLSPTLSTKRRRRSTPRGRRGIGAHWHSRGEWRAVVTGGVAPPTTRTPRGAWISLASIAAVATMAGAAIGIGATRLGWLPATGATPIVLAALAFAASGAFAIIACCVEIDSVVDRDIDRDTDRDVDSTEPTDKN